MNADIDDIALLLLGHLVGTNTPEDEAALHRWCSAAPEHQQLFERVQNVSLLQQAYRQRKAVNTKRALANMLERLENAPLPRQPRRTRLFAGMVAAALLLLLGIGATVWLKLETRPAQLHNGVAQQVSNLQAIAPGSTKALLTMPNGRKLLLGANTQANRRAMANTLNKPSTGVNRNARHVANKVRLDVPRGGEFKIELEDHTEIWLNSDSRLVYPEHFAQHERRVTVEGEAYFKVAKDAERPFYVETAGQQVKVYGTEFNVRAYNDEPRVRTTLVEGSVALSKRNGGGGELLLSPGHQALFDKNTQNLRVTTVNTEVVTGWRSGFFVFENQNLEQIMRDLSRWYLFNYRFADHSLAQIEFVGRIPRYADFRTALSILEKSGNLQFVVQQKTVIVKRK